VLHQGAEESCIFPFIAALGAIWFALCATTALMLGNLPASLRQLPPGLHPWSVRGVLRRILIHRRIVFPLVGLVILIGFVLSFAPVMALGIPRPRTSILDLYVPVEWLIDNTPLRDELLVWANRWGQYENLANASADRLRRVSYPAGPWLYALSWSIFAVASVVAPAWILLIAARRMRGLATALRSRLPATRSRQKQLAVICVAIVLFAVGMGYTAWYWVIPARHVASIPDIGAPFDVEQFGTISVPDERNAFVPYAQANELLATLPEDASHDLALVTNGNGNAPDVLTPVLSTWLATNQPALQAWREGTERPDALYHQPRDVHASTFLPVVDGMRRLSRLALLQAREDRIAGRMDAAWGWSRAALRCSRHCGSHGSLIERLVGCEIYDLASRQAVNWATDDRTTAELLAIALSDVQTINAAAPPFSQNLRTDYFQLTNSIASSADRTLGLVTVAEGPPGSGLSDPQIAAIRSALDFRYRRFEPNWSLRITNLIYANWLPNFDRPRYDRPPRSIQAPKLFLSKAADDFGRNRLATEQIETAFDKTILCKLLLPAVDLVDLEVHRDEMRQGFLLLTLALQRHHRLHGRFPETLEELLDVDLREIPTDPFGTGGPLHYRLEAGVAIVGSGLIEGARTGLSSDQAIEVRAPGSTR